MSDVTPARIADLIGQLDDPILLGARQRYRDEVLLPRDRVGRAYDADGNLANHADMMTGGAAMFFDRSYVRDYLIARIKGQDVMGASVAGLLGAADAYRRAVGIVPTPSAPSVPPTPGEALVPLRVDGTTFRRPDGTIWKYRGVTAFSAFQDFLAGRDLTAYLRWVRSVGGNTIRVFHTWTVTNFNPMRLGPTTLRTEMEAFRRLVNGEGLRLHNVAWCDQDPDPEKGSTVVLSQGDCDILLDTIVGTMSGEFVEVMNEPYQNGGYAMSGQPEAHRLAGTLALRGAVRDGEDPRLAGSLLSLTTGHDPRDAEWPRKAKNLLEASVQGIGTIPATRQPAIGGEPMGIAEAEEPGRRTATPSDCADYFAVAELFAAGACLHGDGATLQRCLVPGPVAQACAEAARDARALIPADAQLGAYTRGLLDDCPLEHSDSLALRTFAMLQGDRATCVVVRPQPGWEPRARNGWTIDQVRGHIITVRR